jgi:hypothetical protein
LLQRKIIGASAAPEFLLYFSWCDKNGACNVDLALRLDVLAICAVFAFVGAILLGAF